MGRPSANTDTLLIKAARELLPETGISGLNIRQVAARADVNLGMFHYHFKNKENFVERVLQEIYEEFFATLTLEPGKTGDSLEQLRGILITLSRFARDNRALLLTLLRDALNGEREVIRFGRANFKRHLQLLIKLMGDAKRDGRIQNKPLPFLVTYTMGSVAMPILIIEFLSKTSARRPFGLVLSVVKDSILSDEAIEARIDLLLSGLSSHAPRKGKA